MIPYKSYKELSRLESFRDRYNYLKIGGIVGEDTFGFDRYLNQALYTSPEWRKVRQEIILRDNGCDLGVDGFDIRDKIIIHHMNPITIEDVSNRDPIIFDPNYLICVSHRTHNAIHYGDESMLPKGPVVRTPNDTCLWKK